jgi:hypothetical protein
MVTKKPAAKKPAQAKRTTKPKTQEKMGRPTSYKPEYAAEAQALTEAGATNVELAQYFEVSISTIWQWQIRNPDFSSALKRGKDVADERVERSLFERATGYSHPELDIRVIDGQIVKTEVIKHYPPDTTAAIFWLKNRRGWRDKVDHNHGVDEGSPLAQLMADLAGKTLKPVE